MAISLTIGMGLHPIGWCDRAIAQITPDNTLGSEQSLTSRATVGRLPATQIAGGAIRGNSLFHSFSNFNVGEDERVYFANPSGIDTILSRVTGNAPSNILGTLGVDGSASLFLLNPNGIIFGPQALLDIRGSFIASTENQFTFPDGQTFSAVNPQAPPLLTVSVPVGLQVTGASAGQPPRDIINHGNLEVGDRQTLALWGGNIINTGTLSTTRGPLQLLATRNILIDGYAALVSTSGGPISLRAGDAITLSNQAGIRGTASFLGSLGNSGAISLHAGTDIILNDAAIFSSVLQQVTGNAGSISLYAGGDITLTQSRVSNLMRGVGDGADIDIQGRSLFILSNSRIASSTSGRGDAGRLRLQAAAILQIDNSILITGPSEDAVGVGGDLVITADQLEIQNQSIVTTGTAGRDRAGDLIINTHDLTIQNSELTTKTTGAGRAGDLMITARALMLVTNEGSVTTQAQSGTGNGGDLSITVPQLIVTEGGQIASGTFSSGNAGNLNINAPISILISGPTSSETISGLFTQSDSNATGTAGTLTISTGLLRLDNGGAISVSGLGGNPGDLVIRANDIHLNQGILEAGTLFGRNANIQLTVQNTLFMENNSRILAAAQNDGSGGNITINAGFIVAALDENSDIIANASDGPGGNIDITANSIIGLVERPAIAGNVTNDIDASSQFGTSGSVSINAPDDPSRGVIELPTNLGDAAGLISQACSAGAIANNRLGEFIVTGRGGLPPNPTQLLGNETVLTQLASAGTETLTTHPNYSLAHESVSTTPPPLVEAQGWVMNHRGEVVLVAAVPPAAQSRSVTPACGSMTQP